MFGAWQAGAWSVLARALQPDLIVGCSVGALNGYAIAANWTPEELCRWWRRPGMASFKNLPRIIETMMQRPLQRDFALVIVDVMRMKPQTIFGPDVRAAHMLASCAVPGAMLPQRIGGRFYVDGGLLNPLPVWAAVELGATRIVAMNVLPQVPSKALAPLVKGFRCVFGYRPALPPDVELTTLLPESTLGSMKDALVWDQNNVDRWIEEGARAAERHLAKEILKTA